MQINEKSYYVSLEDSQKIDESMNLVFSKLETLHFSFEEIYKELDNLNPQEKLFFLDKVLTDLIIRSNMPVFYLNGIINKVSEFVKSLDGKELNEEVKENKFTPSYFG